MPQQPLDQFTSTAASATKAMRGMKIEMDRETRVANMTYNQLKADRKKNYDSPDERE